MLHLEKIATSQLVRSDVVCLAVVAVVVDVVVVFNNVASVASIVVSLLLLLLLLKGFLFHTDEQIKFQMDKYVK